jgi:cyclophilin family peptidyl-prolyl cis-trans isomerase
MNPLVELETSMGVFTLELYKNKAPLTVENFLRYVTEGYYNGTVFHRVIPGFVAQGGGFTTTGDPKPTHSPIKLEAKVSNDRGTIAMARTMDPDSATSQFYINLVDNNGLNPSPGNPGYAAFGAVIEGLDVVDQISEVSTGNRGMHRDWPSKDVVLVKASVK